jgi:uncharacterized protein YeaO (DUF488 family)
MIATVRLGTPRLADEGIQLGTVRHLPRGVRKTDYAALDYFDLWLPELAPSAGLVAWAMLEPWTDARWQKFAQRYRREMQQPAQQRLLALLAMVSKTTNISVGCYCENETRCHRSLLGELLSDAGAAVQAVSGTNTHKAGRGARRTST